MARQLPLRCTAMRRHAGGIPTTEGHSAPPHRRPHARGPAPASARVRHGREWALPLTPKPSRARTGSSRPATDVQRPYQCTPPARAAGRCARAPRRRPPLSKYALFCPARGGVQGCPTLSIVFMAMHATRAASVGCSRGERLGIVLGCAVRLRPCGGPSSSAAQDDRQHKVLVRTNSKTLSRRRGDGFSSVTGSKVERGKKRVLSSTREQQKITKKIGSARMRQCLFSRGW